MGVLEIVLLCIGLLFIIGSFFITEKLSEDTKEEFKKLSSEQIETIIRDRLADANSDLEDKLAEKIDSTIDDLERKADKETSDKIMYISEYTDTVLESVKKSHDEVMFMYSMLNDKQEKINETSASLAEVESKLNSLNESVALKLNMLDEIEKKQIEKAAEEEKRIALEDARIAQERAELEDIRENNATMQEVLNEKYEKELNGNSNKKILELHDMGVSEVEIAKQLGLGMGEVKFVLGLYQEGN